MTYSNEDKLAAVERELGYRRRVYARRVAEGKMTQKLADEQIAVFQAIAEDYRDRAAGDRLL
jgi:hypothetical protein